MPIYFKFVDLMTEQDVDLCEIDSRMCQDLNIPCDEKSYSRFYQVCTDLGISGSIQDSKGEIVRSKLVAAVGDFEEPWQKLLLKYLCDDYRFVSWYQSGHS